MQGSTSIVWLRLYTCSCWLHISLPRGWMRCAGWGMVDVSEQRKRQDLPKSGDASSRKDKRSFVSKKEGGQKSNDHPHLPEMACYGKENPTGHRLHTLLSLSHFCTPGHLELLQ